MERAQVETLVLGWYSMVETGSVLLLTVLASLQYVGTLIAPVFGKIGTAWGHPFHQHHLDPSIEAVIHESDLHVACHAIRSEVVSGVLRSVV
jgi:hypothetical protein